MRFSRVPRRLKDIIDNAQAIFRYSEGMDLTAFEENRMVYDAVERCTERICEAVGKLGDMAGHLMPGQRWQKVRAFGNVLRTNMTQSVKTGCLRSSGTIRPACALPLRKRCAGVIICKPCVKSLQ